MPKARRAYGDLSGDRRRQAQFIAEHPQMAAYERFNRAQQVNTPYGQMYSLFFHTSAMRLWLAGAGVTEQQGAARLEQSFRP